MLAKVAIMVGIAAFAAFNHWRSVAAAVTNLRPLRTAGAAEVVLATGALAAAALLASTPPPAAGLSVVPGFQVSGVDFGTTLRVQVTGVSNGAGPNRFIVTIADYDSGDSLDIRRATLRFAAIDDPRLAPASLELMRNTDGSFAGTGPTLSVAGRWRITALIERSGDAVEVPLGIVQIKSN